MRPRFRARRGAAATLAATAALACASSDAPFHVGKGEEARFQRANRECRVLTVDAEGSQGPIGFDDCMKRRGFRRQGPIRRLFGG